MAALLDKARQAKTQVKLQASRQVMLREIYKIFDLNANNQSFPRAWSISEMKTNRMGRINVTNVMLVWGISGYFKQSGDLIILL